MKSTALLFCIICLCSCEKDINFKLKEAPDLLVVDGSIENGKVPVVTLSKSFDYYSNISLASLDSSFVHDAVVTISNGSQTQKLVEYKASLGSFNVYFYSIDSSNLASSFIGKLNTTYTLKVISAGQEYDATTTIPSLADKIDSIWWQPTPFADDSTETDVFIRSTDPKGLGNYIRYYTKINDGPFLPGQQSVFDDEITDGTTYDLKVTPGIDRNNPISFDKNFFHKGDTVTLKLSNIDRGTYKFWHTMEFAYQSIGNPFASPNVVLGNLSNGGLGAFCGYASAFKTLYIPD